MFKKILFGLCLFVLSFNSYSQYKLEESLSRWEKFTLTFEGPSLDENSIPNPFLDYRLVVDFISPSGEENIVYGYYAADGNAANTSANSGNKWKVNFIPDEIGTWYWIASFRTGSNVGISTIVGEGTPTHFDNASGLFRVIPDRKLFKSLRYDDPIRKGMLQYAGLNHLIYAGSYTSYIKTGTDSPENFLAYVDIDQTYDMGGIVSGYLHDYSEHIIDWKSGDPTWGNGRGKGIIGALNYLASVGVNNVYVITYNLDGGDGQDVWIWTNPLERYRIDVSKLDQWEIIFDHANKLGIHVHMVFQENENTFGLGNQNDIRRKLYYKELISRFGHLLALQYNIGEEDVSSTSARIAYASYIDFIDPYGHPIAVHTNYNDVGTYNGLYGSPYFSASSFQGDGTRYDSSTTTIRNNSINAGRQWVVYGDEQGPDNLNDVNLMTGFFLRNIMSGGAGCEFYGGYPYDLSLDNFRIYEPLWLRLKRARTFIQYYAPYNVLMNPNNSLATNGAMVLSGGGNGYLVYLKNGGATRLRVDYNTTYFIRWFNVSTGLTQLGNPSSIIGPGSFNLTSPFGNNGSLAVIGFNSSIYFVDLENIISQSRIRR